MKNNQEICEMAIPLAYKYIVCFSSDGQYMSILMRKLHRKYNKGPKSFNNRLDIYKIGDSIQEFFHENLLTGEYPFGQFFDAEYDSKLETVTYVEFD